MANELLSVQPEELKFVFEQNKQSSCQSQLLNNTENHVAFKVKTTSPKKYLVRPNTGIILPRSSIDIALTMQAQPEAPPYMQCKDKFLLLSVVVPAATELKDITPDVFNKHRGNAVEECKLRVVYVPPNSAKSGGSSPGVVSFDNENQDGMGNNKDYVLADYCEVTQDDFNDVKEDLKQTEVTLSKLKEERNVSIHQCQSLQQELASLKKQGLPKAPAPGFSFLLVILVGLLGILIGYYARS
ncbi:vesicle-associated protein 2-1 [Cryptomeria japonica]|uniref:vesicle-associated protein 2-1 n=1 Tax=Cryptomeria japonica TaxID=3369 RepID=UPI0027DA2002|nr:vesicle-associated protein 2-1 [Cryptomeria japonica]XP_057816173.2 vesicle-associated protein 2-1 [Cryptomeria japonica]XP_057816180.2 vesicle-associated protein 2-1 [Cryptomeria japonica]XP_057816187.2 vesicle-associated protein 2-1 [Cryptomeria japonica]XP_057816189.2 vesicle-associated protein 2-1 [Cryptomeria japonica]XP_057816193.2 vesicle-associated protein 2-1 [Cryptomeria japonica]XP_057816201.2 vesicle-associated protein 2-1 [Cryptomeria japonica]XP_057816208.2 vesicle-associate